MTFSNKSSSKQNIIKIKIFHVLLRCSLYEHILRTMSVVPYGAFAAKKVRRNEEKLKNQYDVWDLTPTKYSSKYMNSVWGMYNRYSVHNFKKNIDATLTSFSVQQQETTGPKQIAEKNSNDFKGSFSSAKNFLPSPGYL